LARWLLLGNIQINFGFIVPFPFCFQIESPYETERQTDGQTTRRARRVMPCRS